MSPETNGIAGQLEGAAAAFVEALSQMTSMVQSTPRIQKLRDEARAQMGSTPADVVYREHSLTVKRFRIPEGVEPSGTLPLLLVPSLVNKSDILDLLPGESMAQWLVAQGHDVFMIDWGEANPGQRTFNLDYYIDHYIDRVIRRVCKITHAPRIHTLGYCLGGTLLTLYLASRQDAPVATFTAMTTPVNFVDKGMLSWWSRREHFDVDKIVKAYGNIPDIFFRSTFPWIVPTGNIKKLKTIADKHGDDEFLRSFLALDLWITENVPFPGEAYRQLIRELYQENRLMEGTMTISGRPAKLENLKVPTLVYSAKHDHVAPCDSCTSLHERVGAKVKQLALIEAGHLGPALGRDARGKRTTAFWETLDKWIRAEDLPRAHA